MPRKTITIHSVMPTVSRICHRRGRSRYSHCWPNTGLFLAQETPWIDKASLVRLPTTTTTRAPSSPKESQCCLRGSRPAMNGAKKMPAARNAAAVQNRDSWRCQVRARLKGSSFARSMPKKLARSAL
jgi:hypothetical protein